MKLKDFTITPADEKCSIDSVSFDNIRAVMDDKTHKRFLKWMEGQTCGMNGVYAGDLDRFLHGLDCID